MDLKTILNTNDQADNIKVHKKSEYTPTLSKSNSNNNNSSYSNKNEIDDLLVQEKKNMYHKSWNKLDNSSKNNLFKTFVSLEKEKHNLDEKQTLLLMNLLIKNIKKLNKVSEVKYDSDKCEIIEIYNLIYNEEDKSYSLNIIEKKNTKSGNMNRPKSKLDKFLKS